jgi:hypothetical protein
MQLVNYGENLFQGQLLAVPGRYLAMAAVEVAAVCDGKIYKDRNVLFLNI